MKDAMMELLVESTVFQGVITLTVLGVWAYLLLSGQAVPAEVYAVVGTVVGFFFGGKYVQAVKPKPKG